SFLARLRLLRRPVSQAGIVAPPLQQRDRQKELQQSYLHELSQPDFDLGATTKALAGLADRLTDKKANIHNLSKAQQRLTECQLRQLAENFKSFRQLGHSVEVVITRVLMDGVTTKAEKRFLAFLRTIAANIESTGDMIQSLSVERGFNADLTARRSQNF